MQYVLLVTGNSYANSSNLALELAKQLIAAEHKILQIFFYHDGVTNANLFTYPANDEFNITKAWQQFQQEHNVRLNVCITASQRRGIVNSESAATTEHDNLAPHFTLAGLSEFSLAVLDADRLLTI